MFLLNSRQGYFRCDPDTLRCGVIHIANLRMLFCRVPWGSFTRSPWSSRPTHLCRITVRLRIFIFRRFSGKALHWNILFLRKKSCRRAELELNQFSGFSWKTLFYADNTNPITCSNLFPPSRHQKNTQCRNINLLAISCGFRHRLRTD